MTTTLRFRDHEEFHRTALTMAAAGGLAGLAGALVFRGAAAPWSLALIAGAAVLGAAPAAARRTRDLVIGGALAVMASAALILLSRAGHASAGLGAFAGLVGIALGRGSHGRRFLIAAGAGAGVAVVAHHVLGSIASAQELAPAPGWVVATLAGAAFAFVSVLALLPRHLEVAADRVAAAFAGLGGQPGGEVRELCQRGHDLWSQAEGSLAEADPNRRTLEDAVLRLLEVGRRWNSVEAEGSPTAAASLVDRMEALDKRIADTSDPVTRTQYQHAKGALAEQLRYLKDIGTRRERVIARMHNYLAMMERLRMAVLNLRSADASRSSEEIQPIVSDLEEIGRDIDCSSEALAEADRIAAVRPAAQA